jgi:hypothetical protein
MTTNSDDPNGIQKFLAVGIGGSACGSPSRSR